MLTSIVPLFGVSCVGLKCMRGRRQIIVKSIANRSAQHELVAAAGIRRLGQAVERLAGKILHNNLALELGRVVALLGHDLST